MYVVDDHKKVLSTLVDLIDGARGMTVTGMSTAAETALTEIVRLRPDVAVVDGYIDGSDGLDLCRQVKAAVPAVICVMVTAGLGLEWEPGDVADAGVAAVVLKQVRGFPLLQVIAEQAALSRAEA